MMQQMCNAVHEQYSSIRVLYIRTVTPHCLYSQLSQQHVWHEQGAAMACSKHTDAHNVALLMLSAVVSVGSGDVLILWATQLFHIQCGLPQRAP